MLFCCETYKVVTAPHNDMEFLEEICQKNECVAYVCDGAYSMGGHAPVEQLVELQKKYNLFLYIDDSHSLSAYGPKGYGYARSFIGEINNRTILVYSLFKSFGVIGGMVLLNKDNDNNCKLVQRYAGPMAWSQPITSYALGGIIGALKIHKSKELKERQNKLYDNLAVFDSLVDTKEKGSSLPIRLVFVGEEENSLKISKDVYSKGYYVSAVFFPIVPRGKAGLRVMVNANIKKEELVNMCNIINENLVTYGIKNII